MPTTNSKGKKAPSPPRGEDPPPPNPGSQLTQRRGAGFTQPRPKKASKTVAATTANEVVPIGSGSTVDPFSKSSVAIFNETDSKKNEPGVDEASTKKKKGSKKVVLNLSPNTDEDLQNPPKSTKGKKFDPRKVHPQTKQRLTFADSDASLVAGSSKGVSFSENDDTSENPRQHKVGFNLPKTQRPSGKSEDGDIAGQPKKRSRKKGKLNNNGLNNVLHLRDDRHGIYKFRKIGDLGQEDDFLETIHIQRFKDFFEWKRQAHLSLPSNIGVPVENTSDVVQVGLNAMDENEKNDLSAKDAYNNLYDDMEEFYSKDSDVNPRRKTMMLKRQTVILERTSMAKKIVGLRSLAVHLFEKRQQKHELVLQGVQEDLDNVHSILRKKVIDKFVGKMFTIFRDASKLVTFWKSDVNHIHGKYGMGAAAYFEWLRIILLFNILYLVFVIVFVLVPEIELNLDADTNNQSNVTCPSTLIDLSCVLIPSLIPIQPFNFLDLLTGEGFLEGSYMYYSGYRDTVAAPFCPGHGLLEHPESIMEVTAFRFSFVCFLIFLVNSIFMALQVKQYYHKTRVEAKVPGLQQVVKFKALVSSWNFSCASEKAAEIRHRGIWRDFKKLLITTVDDKTAAPRASTFIQATHTHLENTLASRYTRRTAIFLVHCIANLAVLLIYAVAFWILYLSLHYRHHWASIQQTECKNLLEVPSELLILPAIAISVLNIGVTKFFMRIVAFESWESLENRNLAFITRVGFYYIINIVVLYGYWQIKATDLIEENLCYEESFGKELYRIVWFQGLFHFTISFAGIRIYDFIMRRKDPQYKKPKFDPMTCTLNIIFLHTLSGIGFVFCPLISLLLVIRMIGTFYHHKDMLSNWCCFPTQVVHTSEIAAPYLVGYFLSHLLTTILNLILLAEFHPSSSCGPFSHFNEMDKNKNHLGHYWQVFTEGLDKSTSAVLKLLMSPGVVVVLIIIFIGICYTLRNWGRGYLITMEKLHEYLVLERQDRDFLLEAIFHLAKKNAKEEPSEHEHGARKVRNPSATPSMTSRTSEVSLQDEEGHWRKSDVVQGIFANRRGTMAYGLLPGIGGGGGSTRGSRVDLESTMHGTVERQLREEFDWLPSQWMRRKRRSATHISLTDEDREALLKKFRKNVNKKSQDVVISVSKSSLKLAKGRKKRSTNTKDGDNEDHDTFE